MATPGLAIPRGGDAFGGGVGAQTPLLGEILIARCGVAPDSIERALASSARRAV